MGRSCHQHQAMETTIQQFQKTLNSLVCKPRQLDVAQKYLLIQGNVRIRHGTQFAGLRVHVVGAAGMIMGFRGWSSR